MMLSSHVQFKTQPPKEASLRVLLLVLLYTWVIYFLLSFTSGAYKNINAEVADGTFSNKLFWISVFIYALYLWQMRKTYKLYNLSWHIYLLIIYMVLAVLSAFWSDVPLISLRRSLQQVMMIFCLLTPFLHGVNRTLILDKVCQVLAIFILINVALIPVFGIADFGYRGICPQKNILGQISTVAFFFCSYAAIAKVGVLRKGYVAISIMAVGLCLISNSKTSLALLVSVPVLSFVLIQFATIEDNLKRIAWLFFIIITTYLIYAASILIPFDIYDISSLMYHDRTFTGRTAIWDFSGYYINQSPVVGFGYGSFWGVGSSSKAIGQGFIDGLLQAHNGYVDIVLELGYLGLAVATLFILVLVNNIFKTSKKHKMLGMLLFSSLLFVLLNNTMESSLFRGYAPLWIVVLLCVGLASPEYEKIDQERL
ncbi:O-antigen polymerase [Methylotenera mobilis JLW8]|uniref:O-antigen polymerase n=2 Tax=Methylotenera mobilis TaxID=359408 RepID=C6WXP5_METML|nr:O-antigen polymerase [Methylotenera mobilis JLW8]